MKNLLQKAVISIVLGVFITIAGFGFVLTFRQHSVTDTAVQIRCAFVPSADIPCGIASLVYIVHWKHIFTMLPGISMTIALFSIAVFCFAVYRRAVAYSTAHETQVSHLFLRLHRRTQLALILLFSNGILHAKIP